MIQGHGLLHLYPSCWAFGLCYFALPSYFNWSHTHTHIHKIIKLEGHGKRESRKTHSFSVIGYIFEFLFFFFSGTVTIPESYLAKEDSLGWSNILLQFLTILSCYIFSIKQARRIQCDLRNQISQVKHALRGTKNQIAILNKIEYSELCS